MRTYEDSRRQSKSFLVRYAGAPRPYSSVSPGMVSVLLPGLRRRTHRQLHEWTWVVWLLLVGWWLVPTVLAVWVLWTIFKLVVLTIVWLINTAKDWR